MSLEDFKQALEEADEIELTVIGRKSGRRLPRPVWFVHDGRKLYLLPVQGSQTQWFKNVLANPAIRLKADGAAVSARAEPTTDPEKVHAVVEKFRHKYGNADVKRYYSNFDAAVEVPLATATD
jgi:deazaflavin-dependent oxidoreductase (nitroreductase family)